MQNKINASYVGAAYLFPLCLFFLLLSNFTYPEFPHITAYDLNGTPHTFPSQERQIIFLGASPEVLSDLRSWNREFFKNPLLIKDASLRGLAILPKWAESPLSKKLALLYVRLQVPEPLQKAVFVYFGNEAELNDLFHLPENTSRNLHLFYLNEQGHVLTYTYGSPTSSKLDVFFTISRPPVSSNK
jgi:hypothetical protein